MNDVITPEQVAESGWLVEISDEGRPRWLILLQSGYEEWTGNAIEATRFARKQDAEAAIGHCNVLDGRATEHQWG